MTERGTHILTMLWFFFLIEVALVLCVDQPLAAWAHQMDTDAHGVVEFFRAITDLGKSIWYLVPSGVAVIICFFMIRSGGMKPKRRRRIARIGLHALFLFATIGISGIVADLFKPLVGRARPLLWFRDGVFGIDPFNKLGSLWNSFPSGHTTTAFALACSLSVFLPRWKPVWFAYALLLAASRVMVTAHYASDVFAGAVLGWLTVALTSKYGINLTAQVIFPIDSKAPENP